MKVCASLKMQGYLGSVMSVTVDSLPRPFANWLQVLRGLPRLDGALEVPWGDRGSVQCSAECSGALHLPSLKVAAWDKGRALRNHVRVLSLVRFPDTAKLEGTCNPKATSKLAPHLARLGLQVCRRCPACGNTLAFQAASFDISGCQLVFLPTA